MTRRGFSLIEVLVTVGIVSVLLGMVLAAVQRARDSARRAGCQNQLRQQGLAVFSFESTHGRLPPGVVWGPFEPLGVPDGANHGLWPFLLKHLGEQPAAERYRFDLSYDHLDNRPATTARVRVLECGNALPGRAPNHEAAGPTDFGPVHANPFLAGLGVIDEVGNYGGALAPNKMVRMTDIKDGASNTLLVAEAGGRPGWAWAAPTGILDLRELFPPGPDGLHRGGTNVCMADGSVRFVRDTVDLRILGRLATRAGGEPVRGDEY